MTDLIDEGGEPRSKRPAGYYSKAARAHRTLAAEKQRCERALASEQARLERQMSEVRADAQIAPFREFAKRKLAAIDAPAQEHQARPKARRPKRDRRPQLQRLIAARADASKAAWARRHPAAAAAERRLRKDRAQLVDQWKHKNEGTPETHQHASRCNQGALARLYLKGTIDADQLAAAVEIAQVIEWIGGDVTVRTASLETRVDVTRLGDGTIYERLGQVRREVAYTQWRSQITGPIGAVLEMIAGDPVGFTIVAKRYRMHNRKAKRLLLEALDLWPRILGEVRKEIDYATLAAAHAGILS